MISGARAAVLGGLLCLFACGASAQEVQPQGPGEPIHWAFASLVGSGWYKVGEANAFLLGVTPRQTIRQPAPFGTGARKAGINIRYDAAFGLYSLDDLFGVADFDNLSTLSFTPGVEFVIPVRERWQMRAFANFGWGTALDDDLSAWVYFTAVKSEYVFDAPRGRLALLNGVYYAGYSPDPGPSGNLTALFAGLEYRHGFSRPQWRGEPLDLVWHTGYTAMNNSAEFGLRDGSFGSVGNTVEFGLAAALRNRNFRFGWFEFEQVGLTYSRDNSGDFGSVTLNLTSWFRK
jgi:hypothetical protein